MSIKGISHKVATALIEKTNGFQDFSSAKALAKFIRLAPTTYQSSKLATHRGICRTGDPHLRGLLYIASWSAIRYRDQMRLWQPPRPVMQKSAALSALRQRLLRVRQQLQQPLTEQAGFIDAALQRQLIKNCQASLNTINTDLKIADSQLDELIQNDDRLKELFSWITSVPDVGSATATEVLVATDEFKAISDPKKLACHAGVAPLEYRSGSSVRSKTRVNQYARLRLKSVFHLGAMLVIQTKGELRDYYRRKVGDGVATFYWTNS